MQLLPTLISGVAALGGTVGNLLTGAKANSELQNLTNTQNAQQNFLLGQEQKIAGMTPAQLTSLVTQAEQPINQNLINAVTTPVTANLAERGLSQAPGINAAAESTALAPYQQQNYNTALNQVMQQLQIPLSAASTSLGGNQTAGILGLLNSQKSNNTGAYANFISALTKYIAGSGGGAPSTGLTVGTGSSPLIGPIPTDQVNPDAGNMGANDLLNFAGVTA